MGNWIGGGPARRGLCAALAAGLVIGAGGCALFESSGSVSDSSGSFSNSSESSSDSSHSSGSSSGDEDDAYREDVRGFTVAHVAAEGAPEALRLGLAEIALARGISDWEALPQTYLAIGAGLAEAGVSEAQLAVFEREIAPVGTSGFEALRAGYASVARPQRPQWDAGRSRPH